MRYVMVLALGFSLSMVGCGPNKSVQKGDDPNFVLQTKADGYSQDKNRPIATPPAGAGSKTGGSDKDRGGPGSNQGKR